MLFYFFPPFCYSCGAAALMARLVNQKCRQSGLVLLISGWVCECGLVAQYLDGWVSQRDHRWEVTGPACLEKSADGLGCVCSFACLFDRKWGLGKMHMILRGCPPEKNKEDKSLYRMPENEFIFQ